MFDDLRNNIDFFIRNKTKLSRKNFVETDVELLKRNELENLYTKDVLNQFLDKTSRKQAQVLDIGCKNWFYAKGEYDYFANFAKDFILDGVELDAYRLYSNFYNRYEVAQSHIKDLKNVNYIVGNLLDINERYDYIIWFLPFVLKEPHKLWGLPEKYFYPEKLLKHAYNLLNNNGQMLIINQGDLEAETQKILFEKLNIKYSDLGEVTSKAFQYKHKRFAFIVKKINNISPSDNTILTNS